MLNWVQNSQQRPDRAEAKNMRGGRYVFSLLLYVLIFTLGINVGKWLSDREHKNKEVISEKLGSVRPLQEDMSNLTEQEIRQKLEMLMALEVERRLKNQLEEKVRDEIEGTFSKAKAIAERQLGQDEPQPTRDLESMEEESAPARPKVQKEVKKRKPASAPYFTIKMSQHKSKSDAHVAIQSIASKGVKSSMKSFTDGSGESAYGVFIGQFKSRAEAKTFQRNVLRRKGFADLGQVQKVTP